MQRWVVVSALAWMAAAVAAQGPTQAEESLLKYAVDRGSQISMTFGRSCPTCPRGMLATRDIAEGEAVLELPLTLAIPTHELGYQGFPSEYAHHLLRRMHLEPDFNTTHALYLATLPQPGELLSAELFTDELLEMLQFPALAGVIRGQAGVAEQVFNGSYRPHQVAPLSTALGTDVVALDVFKRWSALVGSRDFSLAFTGGLFPFYMVPVADIVNHSDEPNAQRGNNDTHMLMHALQPIPAGVEVTNNYQPMVIHRADIALAIYGFFTVRDPPLLAALDLPTYSAQATYAKTPEDDSEFYGPDGAFNTPAERDRLAAALAEMPTSEAEDEALLRGRLWGWLGGGLKGWQQRTVVEFRLARKRALRHAIALIDAELSARADEAQDEAGRGGDAAGEL